MDMIQETKYSTLKCRRKTNREEGGGGGGADLVVEPAHLISYKYVAQWNFQPSWIQMNLKWKQYKSINFYGQFDNNLTWQ